MKAENKELPRKPLKHKKLIFFIHVFLSIFFAGYTVQFFPPIYLFTIQIDLFLFIVIYFILLQFILLHFVKRFLWLIYSGIILIICLTSLTGHSWSFKTMYHNAQINTIQLFSSISAKVDIKPAINAIIPHISLQQRIQQKVNPKDSTVRVFAVKNSLLYFDEYYSKFNQICRQLSLIKYIKDNYKYVKDPNGFDYFASPQESCKLMAGDCDDYSILMASCLEAIGADVRIIWAPNHVYPELYCGNKKNFDKYAGAIYSLFETEIGDKKIFFRLDKNGNYWINIDFTDKYPGSYYLTEEVLSIIYIN